MLESGAYYGTYHGHTNEDLTTVHKERYVISFFLLKNSPILSLCITVFQSLREEGKPIIWLAGDSSLDNKARMMKMMMTSNK